MDSRCSDMDRLLGGDVVRRGAGVGGTVAGQRARVSRGGAPALAAALCTLAALCAVASLGGCASDNGTPDGPSLATWNVGLADGFVPRTADRRPLIAPAVAALPDDVICLQEVWADGDGDAIIAASADSHPHHVRWLREETVEGPPACSTEEASPLKTCAETSCAGEADLANCVLANCADEFAGVSDGCAGCLAANLGLDIPGIFGACAVNASGKSYNGRVGLLLLSRHPITQSDHIELDSYLTARAALHARVAMPAGDLDVFCTHLTADLSQPPYAGAYESWQAEQRAQAETLLAWVDTKRADERVALLGDFNSGPAIGAKVREEVGATWQTLIDAGLSTPWVDDGSGPCTYCDDNPLIGAGEPGAGVLIDHVLVTSAVPTGAVERFADEVISLELAGETNETRLSDHYGVRLELAE